MTSVLVGNPRWRLFLDGERVFLSGGADEVYLVDEIDSLAAAQRLLDAAHLNDFDAVSQDPELVAALRQLRHIGAVATKAQTVTPLSIAIAWSGDALPSLSDSLAKQIELLGNTIRIGDISSAQLLLFIRTNAPWLETIATYAKLKPVVPQLFVDLAYRHTLGLGPYVVPNETACIACLGHRIAHQWGDVLLPSQPQTTLQSNLVAGLLSTAISDFVEHGMCTHYLERAVSLNLQTLHSQRDRVFRLPWCPQCGTVQADASLPLPWMSNS